MPQQRISPTISQDHKNNPATSIAESFVTDNALLTARQIYRDILQVSRPTLYRMMKDGSFPVGFKVKGSYRWHVKTVRDWQEQQYTQATE